MSDRERNFPDLGFEESEADVPHGSTWEDPAALPPEDWEAAAWEDPDALPPDDWEAEESAPIEVTENSVPEAEPAPVATTPDAPEAAAPSGEGPDAVKAEATAEPPEPRAIDLIRAAQPAPDPNARRPGERLSRRVNSRRVVAPGSARRTRLFERMGLADPYNPDAKERSLPLGPVALKLDGKRQPAPHARPKAPASQKKKKFAPKVPRAPRPTAPPTPKPKAAAAKKPASRPQAAKNPDAPPPPLDRTPPRVGPPKPAGGLFGGGGRSRRAGGRPPKMAAGRTAPVRPLRKKDVPADLDRSIPTFDRTPPSSSRSPKKTRAGRQRLRRQVAPPVDRGPVVIEAPKLKEAYTGPDPAAAEAEPTPEPVRRSIPQGGETLDDLFGFSQNEGRMRIPRRSKPAPAPDDDDE